MKLHGHTDNKKTIQYIALTLLSGIGPVGQNRLLDICGDVGRCFEADENELKSELNSLPEACRLGECFRDWETPCFCEASHFQKSKSVDLKLISSLIQQRSDKDLFRKAEELLEKSRKDSIDIITKEDSTFPKRFYGNTEIPLVLYVKGSLEINSYSDSIGIIGARRCTRDGRDKAVELTKEAIKRHKAVVSGMAKGIDSYAHTAVIKEGGYTIAVLGCGPDICYPKEHKALYDEIVLHGCILSEYPPGTTPRSYMFPRRNRLIAALSDDLYVIEAGRNSGTQSTVGFCEKYGRNVYRI